MIITDIENKEQKPSDRKYEIRLERVIAYTSTVKFSVFEKAKG
jgi:hypothetical protein